jgi:hypothetical protein
VPLISATAVCKFFQFESLSASVECDNLCSDYLCNIRFASALTNKMTSWGMQRGIHVCSRQVHLFCLMRDPAKRQENATLQFLQFQFHQTHEHEEVLEKLHSVFMRQIRKHPEFCVLICGIQGGKNPFETGIKIRYSSNFIGC